LKVHPGNAIAAQLLRAKDPRLRNSCAPRCGSAGKSLDCGDGMSCAWAQQRTI